MWHQVVNVHSVVNLQNVEDLKKTVRDADVASSGLDVSRKTLVTSIWKCDNLFVHDSYHGYPSVWGAFNLISKCESINLLDCSAFLGSGPLCSGAWSHEEHRFTHFVLYLSKNTKFKVVEWSSQNLCYWNYMAGLEGLKVHAIKPQKLNKLEQITGEKSVFTRQTAITKMLL